MYAAVSYNITASKLCGKLTREVRRERENASLL
jgi:hypothetical protein